MPVSDTVFTGNLMNPSNAVVMLHGRGAGAEDILGLSSLFDFSEFLIVAPQAPGFSWYPHSFLSDPARNEPALSRSLKVVGETVTEIESRGIARQQIYFLGFSQGACLALEYSTREATRWGGVLAFTGGLIGDKIYTDNYSGNFQQTPVFIGSSDPDMHVPVERVYATVAIMQEMNAAVTLKIYKNMGHTVTQDEVEEAKKAVFSQRSSL